MDAFVNLLKGFGERISNPVASTFAIAFAICNWPITLAIFTGDAADPTSRIDTIRAILESSAYECQALRLFIFPIASAALYLWGMPFLKKIATAHINKKQFEGDKIKEQAYLNIIGEMHEHEKTIQFAHQEIQNAFATYQNTLNQIKDLSAKPDLDEKARVLLSGVFEQNLGNLRRLQETDEKFLRFYLLIQGKNNKKS